MTANAREQVRRNNAALRALSSHRRSSFRSRSRCSRSISRARDRSSLWVSRRAARKCVIAAPKAAPTAPDDAIVAHAMLSKDDCRQSPLILERNGNVRKVAIRGSDESGSLRAIRDVRDNEQFSVARVYDAPTYGVRSRAAFSPTGAASSRTATLRRSTCLRAFRLQSHLRAASPDSLRVFQRDSQRLLHREGRSIPHARSPIGHRQGRGHKARLLTEFS